MSHWLHIRVFKCVARPIFQSIDKSFFYSNVIKWCINVGHHIEKSTCTTKLTSIINAHFYMPLIHSSTQMLFTCVFFVVFITILPIQNFTPRFFSHPSESWNAWQNESVLVMWIAEMFVENSRESQPFSSMHVPPFELVLHILSVYVFSTLIATADVIQIQRE